MPLCHCAFIGCNWTSNAKPCERLVCNADITGVHNGATGVHNGEWKPITERFKFDVDMYGCCGDAHCIKHHILAAHRAPLVESCSLENIAEDSFDYYCEAIAWREQQKMPCVGISIDRRVFNHVLTRDVLQS